MDERDKKVAKKTVVKYNAYKKVFSGPEGKLVLEDMMANHGMMAPMYKGNVKDMLIKEGERNAVLRILTILNVDITALKERIEHANKEME